jgi:uncharacterized membrane protein YccC
MASPSSQEYCQRFRVHLALKVAFGAALCACVSNLFHLNVGYLSSLIVALVLVVFHGQTLRAGVPAFLGVLVAGTVQIGITMFLSDSGLAYVLCSLLWLFLWMAFLPTLPLGHMLGGILIAMILFNFALGTAELRTLVHAFWMQCFVGISIAVGLDRLLWPSKMEDVYFEALARLLESFARDIETIAGTSPGESRDRPAHATELRHIAQLANLSRGALPGDDGARVRLNFTCRLIWERIRLATQFLAGKGMYNLSPQQLREFHAIFTGLAQHYRKIAAAALCKRPAPDIDPAIPRMIDVLTEKLRNARESASSVDATAPIVRLLTHGREDHERVVAAYNAILASLSRKRDANAALASIFAHIFAWPQPSAFKVAARIALIVLTLFIVVTYLHFPGSSLVAFYGVAFGLTANVGQLYMKGRSGALGVLGGIAIGLVGVLLVKQCPHFPMVMLLFPCAMFLAAYASTAPEPIGFAGLQAALLTPYMFIYYEGPHWTVANAVTRASALVVSAGVAMLVQRLVWPVDPLVLFRKVISQTLDTIAAAWERLRRNQQQKPDPSGLAAAFDQSVTLLQDSRYVIGSRHPLAHAYLQLLRSLQDMFASMQALSELLTLEREDKTFEESVRTLDPHVATVTETLEAIARHVVQQGSSDLQAMPPRLAALRDAAKGLAQNCRPDSNADSRRRIAVLSSLVCEIADSLDNAVAAARKIPAGTPVPMIGSSEGWRSSARATPAH